MSLHRMRAKPFIWTSGALILSLLLNVSPAAAAGYGNETVQFIGAGDDVMLNGTTVNGNVMTGKNILAKNCQVSGNMMGGQIQVEDCRQVGAILGKSVDVKQTVIDRNIQASNSLQLVDTTVRGNVTSAGQTHIENSTVEGQLTVTGKNLTLNGAKLGSLVIQAQPPNGEHLYLSGGHVTVGNLSSNRGILINSASGNGMSVNGLSISTRGGGQQSLNGQGSQSSIAGQGGRAVVMLNHNGMAAVKGYSVRSSGGQTTLITPEGWQYVNGRLQSGEGPDNYAAYASEHPQAPLVQGPGWVDTSIASSHNRSGSAESAASSTQDKPETQNQPSISVHLQGHSVIQGDIVFENLPGRVVLSEQAKLLGQVVNGELEKQK